MKVQKGSIELSVIRLQFILFLGVFCCRPIQAAPISVNPAETSPLQFTELKVPVDRQLELDLLHARIQDEIQGELRKFGYAHEETSGPARFMLGGMMKAIRCTGRTERSCETEILWELWDSKHAAVVYRVLTRATALQIPENERIPGLKRLVISALHSLLSRPRFVETMKKDPNAVEPAQVQDKYEDAAFRACVTPALKMPKDAQKALAATTLIKSGSAIGSGVSISPDGFILTAAHVVRGQTVTVIFQDGKEYTATIIRKNRKTDVALLKLKGTDYPCLNPRRGGADVGEKIFAIGSPASEELAFSLTTGIISAERSFDNFKFLQTDASINPGNSGGPLIDEDGNILAIVSWKVVGIGVEGIGFGVPMDAAFQALSIEPGKTSAAILEQKNRTLSSDKKTPVAVYEDIADQKQSPLPAEEKTPKKKNSAWKRPFKHATRWIGVGLFTVGAGLTAVSYARVKKASGMEYDDWNLMTYSQYRAWVAVNIAGWVAAPVGAALFIVSFLARPDKELPASDWEVGRARIGVRLLDNGAMLDVRF